MSGSDVDDLAAQPTVALPREQRAPVPEPAVIEEGLIPRRLRRPLDLARFALAITITGAIILLAYFASGTSSGIGADISEAIALLPDVVVLVVNVIGGIGTLALPIAAAVSLVLRRRVRQLFDSLLGLLLTVVLLTTAAFLIDQYASTRFIIALAGSTDPRSAATAPILGGLVAFLTVGRLASRRPWNVLGGVVITSLVIVLIISGGITLAGIAMSLFTGWAIGLLLRYVLGTPTTRPTGIDVAAALERGGFPLTRMQASRSTAIGRRYVATTRSGDALEVVVLDRDLEGAGLVASVWRALRLRDEPGTGAFNMRRTLDHSALMAFAAEAAGAPVPRLVLASSVGADSALLAYEYVDGKRMSELTDLTDAELESAWRALRTMQEHQMTHRSLIAENLVVDAIGRVWMIGEEAGAVASSDVAQRIDTAELLCTLALIVGPDRAVRSGRKVLGVSGLSRALPALQPVALSGSTRRRMRRNKELMIALRDALVEIKPGEHVEQIQLERIKPRTLIMIVVGAAAAYVLLSQLASVDLIGLLRNADWGWMAIAVGAALLTYVGAAWSLSGFVPERLSLRRTMMAQVAGDFATLVSPPTLGAVAINLRFLQKAGLHPALAAASVGVSQVAAFVVHILLLLGFGIAAGTQADFTFDPPPWAVIAVVALAIMLIAVFAVPQVRRFVFGRVRPLLKEVVPRLVTVAQRPMKLVEGIGGILLLNAAYIVVLLACVEAFGGQITIAAVAVVYLAGATLGQAAPTPGGLGAVEAALAAGLTAAGLDGGLAVSSVLLFRLVTFWIPTVPGYLAFNSLTRRGAL